MIDELVSQKQNKKMDPLRNKVGKKKKRSNLKIDALKWLSHTQFHGANRLTDKKTSWYWIPTMLFLLIACISLVWSIIDRYRDNPTFIMQKDTVHGVTAFPSVIICPEVEFNSERLNKFLSMINYPKGLNESYIRKIVSQLGAFFSPDVLYDVDELETLEHLLKYNNIDVETAGQMMTISCEETVFRCKFDNHYMNCSDVFKMELTRDGFCCVFNGRSLRREMKEGRRRNKITPRLYTQRFGFTSGLMMAINQTQKPLNIDLNYKWLALQSGQNFVDTTINGTPLNPGSEQWVAYYIYSLHISESARGLSAQLRRCTMADEELKYFPSYRRKYCVVECEMANTIKRCNCVRIVHPRPRGVPYCSARRLQCAMHAIVDAERCQCLSTCDVDTALTRISSFTLDPNVPVIDNFYTGLNYEKITVVRTFIQKRIMRTKQRWSYYTYLDLFAQLGGMFNVFFGCSILTMLGLVQLGWRVSVTLLMRIRQKLPRKKKMTEKK